MHPPPMSLAFAINRQEVGVPVVIHLAPMNAACQDPGQPLTFFTVGLATFLVAVRADTGTGFAALGATGFAVVGADLGRVAAAVGVGGDGGGGLGGKCSTELPGSGSGLSWYGALDMRQACRSAIIVDRSVRCNMLCHDLHLVTIRRVRAPRVPILIPSAADAQQLLRRELAHACIGRVTLRTCKA